MTFFVEISTSIAAKAVEISIEQLAKHNKSYLTDTMERLKDGSLGIFVFGPQGVGKTTLMNVLSGSSEINDIPTEYQSSAKNERMSFGGHVYFKVFSAPGQTSLADIHWPDLFEKMNRYQRVLCIFCCSYGCHTNFELGAEENGQSFLEEHRGIESELFLNFCTQLKSVTGKLALMLLVTKQDLWWDQRIDVENHYLQAKFAKGFRLLEENKKASGFISARSSVSLSIQNLYNAYRQLIKSTVGGYDQLIQKANFGSFLTQIEMALSSF